MQVYISPLSSFSLCLSFSVYTRKRIAPHKSRAISPRRLNGRDGRCCSSAFAAKRLHTTSYSNSLTRCPTCDDTWPTVLRPFPLYLRRRNASRAHRPLGDLSQRAGREKAQCIVCCISRRLPRRCTAQRPMWARVVRRWWRRNLSLSSLIASSSGRRKFFAERWKTSIKPAAEHVVPSYPSRVSTTVTTHTMDKRDLSRRQTLRFFLLCFFKNNNQMRHFPCLFSSAHTCRSCVCIFKSCETNVLLYIDNDVVNWLIS